MENIFLFKGRDSLGEDDERIPKTTHEELMKWLNTLIPAATKEQANMRPLDIEEHAKKVVAQGDDVLIKHYD